MIYNTIQGLKLDLIYQPEKILSLIHGLPTQSEFIWVFAVTLSFLKHTFPP